MHAEVCIAHVWQWNAYIKMPTHSSLDASSLNTTPPILFTHHIYPLHIHSIYYLHDLPPTLLAVRNKTCTSLELPTGTKKSRSAAGGPTLLRASMYTMRGSLCSTAEAPRSVASSTRALFSSLCLTVGCVIVVCGIVGCATVGCVLVVGDWWVRDDALCGC